MKNTRSWTRRAGLVGMAAVAAAGAIATVAPGADAKRPTEYTVIATGLDNPRGLAVNGNQALYIAEAGLGDGNDAAGVVEGVGNTGGLSVVWSPRSNRSTQQRLVSGLPSAAAVEGPPGSPPDAIGLDGLSFSGGKLYGIIGGASKKGGLLGDLVRFECIGRNLPPKKPCLPTTTPPVSLADVGNFNIGWTEDQIGEEWGPPEPDANPYGVLVSGNKRYVVDAGANTVNQIDTDGSVHVIALIPPGILSDSTPTCITKGPDGALYVGTLNLFDYFVFGSGQASIWRIDPKQTIKDDIGRILSVATQWATGLDTITGCAYDGRGHIVVVGMFTDEVVRVPFKHPSTGRQVLSHPSMVQPNGIAIAQDGTIYVSALSSQPAANQGIVVRIVL